MTLGIHPDHLRLHVIRPTLERMGMWSYTAEDLLLGTAAQESHMGKYLQQIGSGPAVGPWQIEPLTAKDTIKRYLQARPKKQAQFEAGFQLVNTADIDWENVPLEKITEKLQTDLAFSVAVARMKYAMVPEASPAMGDIAGYAAYWKKHFNTPQGAGTENEFIKNWKRFNCAG